MRFCQYDSCHDEIRKPLFRGHYWTEIWKQLLACSYKSTNIVLENESTPSRCQQAEELLWSKLNNQKDFY